MKYLDDLIGLFCDPNREKFKSPVKHGEKIVATDANALIVAPGKYFQGTYPLISLSYPDYERIIPDYSETKLFEVDPEFLFSEIAIMPKEHMYTDCERCEGEGSLYTRRNNRVDCDECDGTGHDEYLGEQIPLPNREEDDEKSKAWVLQIQGILFNPNLLLPIVHVARRIGSNIQFRLIREGNSSIIYIDDIMVLFMPIKMKVSEIKDYRGQLTVVDVPLL